MIQVTIDKATELEWIKHIIDMGVLNSRITDETYKELIDLGVKTEYTVSFVKSDTYENDIDGN